MTKVLVTGGAGFIGSNLVEALVARGTDVRVLDDFSSGRMENLEAVLGSIKLLRGDICERDAVEEAVRDVEVVYHLAAVTPVPQSMKEPAATARVNVEGTVRVLDVSRKAGVRLVVLASSASVYGNASDLPVKEEHALDPLSPYAVSKVAAEYFCRVFATLFPMSTICLRYFNVYGPRQDPLSPYAAVVPKFIDACLGGDGPIVFGDGKQTRDFTYVDDVARANMLLLDCDRTFRGEVVNVATGTSVSINHLLRVVQQQVGSKRQPEYREPRVGDIKFSSASIDRAGELLGFSPSWSFSDGVKKTVDWYRSALKSRI